MTFRSLPHGVFLGSHAVAEGWLTRKQIQSGLYRRLLHNVYADPGLPVDHRLMCRGVALVMPDEAALGGRSAAAWFGAPYAGFADPVTVIAPTDNPWRGPRGVRLHRTDLRLGEVLTLDEAIRVTDPLRTAWDVATLERTPDAVAALDGMLRARSVTAEQLAGLHRWAPGHWRSRRARLALHLADGRAQSPPESWVRVACHQAGLPSPAPQWEVVENGVFLGRVDLAWPEAKLIVEYEGEYHFDELQIRKDDARYAAFVAAGWRIIRLSSADLRDMEGVLSRIREALAEGAVAG